MRFDGNVFWKQRFAILSKEIVKYTRYIFNGHFVIALIFLLGALAYYYQEWVKTLNPDFPAAILMAAVLSLIVTYSPIYTFLMEADCVFLIPLENEMKPYFEKAIKMSFTLQLYGLAIGLAIFMPMYAQVKGGNFKSFLIFLIVMSALKWINLLIRWRVQFFVDTNIHRIDSVVRYFVNGVFLYLMFNQASILFLIPVALILCVLYFYYLMQTKNKGLKWEFLILQDERRLMSFYRLANLFTDVPKLKDRIKERKWLNWIISSISYKHENSYMYLFVHTFIRSGDYFGLFIRLTAIGIIGLAFFTYGYGDLVFAILFLYLTGFQLLPLWKHHENKLWLAIYPVEENLKWDSFKKLLSVILIVQTLFFAIPFFMKEEWTIACLFIASGVVFSILFSFVYAKRKVHA